MTEESNNTSIPPEKLLIDKPSDFQFHAAYLAYSDTYDKTSNPETKKQLNQNITSLQQNQIDYHTFYRNINQFREETSPNHSYGRAQIRTQKKREWRRKSQKRERNKRHKK
ncbi:MAG: hypothetical protein OEY24_05955 [Candidatus Bathyarchaeota archaeon]|nr:hypothetical protein [Candidatus Bathyarchaeota archaeon]MDH5495230.1 hypothetical protein [Candidatus Bathyarchaeota archaeon]